MSGGSSAVALASLAFTAVGTAAGVMGQITQQNAQAQAASVNAAQARYQAQVAAQNMTLMDQQAADAKQRGQVAEENRRRLTQQQVGQQTAQLAAQGTDLEGSPLDILGDTRAAGELDARTIRGNALREAYGYQIQGLGYGNQSVLESTRAANSVYTPNYLGAGASLLAGASTLADKWRRFQTTPSYYLSEDSARTANDRDLNGYN
jgi:hypothetical protein